MKNTLTTKLRMAGDFLGRAPSVPLILFFVTGLLLRFTNINWDSYMAFHPDERNISWAVTRVRFFTHMNPEFFAYGGFPIYLYRAIGEIVVIVTKNSNWLFDWGHIAIIGRTVSATLSSISILLMYLVADSFFSRPVGLLAAFFLAFSPWAIQQAHFGTTETMLVFFLLSLLSLAHKYVIKPSKKSIGIQGIILGLAIAAKTTGILFTLIPLAAILLRFMNQKQPLLTVRSMKKILSHSFGLSTIAAAVALFFSPYTILDFQKFSESMRYETGVALGTLTVPYTLQFLGTVPYLYQIQTMIWQAGPVAMIGILGLIVLLLYTLKHKKWVLTLFTIFPIVYGVYAGSWFAKFSRYNVPFLPFVTIAAAWLLILMYKKFRLTGLAVLTFTVCVTLLWGLATWSVYLRPQTRIAASEWIINHIPPNAKIYTEHWNDGLPLTLPDRPAHPYNRDLLAVYDTDTKEKENILEAERRQGDYIILSTRRIWGTMPRLTERYPFTSRWYQNLLNGNLGYKEVASFSSYPELFGFIINDDAAEESIQVFDHPTVRIFKNDLKGK